MVGKFFLLFFGVILLSVGITLSVDDGHSILRERMVFFNLLPVEVEEKEVQVQEKIDPVASFSAWVEGGR